MVGCVFSLCCCKSWKVEVENFANLLQVYCWLWEFYRGFGYKTAKCFARDLTDYNFARGQTDSSPETDNSPHLLVIVVFVVVSAGRLPLLVFVCFHGINSPVCSSNFNLASTVLFYNSNLNWKDPGISTHSISHSVVRRMLRLTLCFVWNSLSVFPYFPFHLLSFSVSLFTNPWGWKHIKAICLLRSFSAMFPFLRGNVCGVCWRGKRGRVINVYVGFLKHYEPEYSAMWLLWRWFLFRWN